MKSAKQSDINSSYTAFYESKNPQKVYPTEFVVRTFLGKYPGLNISLKLGYKVLDIGFGDGRNTGFLIEQGYDVYGIEITQKIVDLTMARLKSLGLSANLKVGRNSNIPFDNNFFDVVLACHSSYYCDAGETFHNNLTEISRVIKKGGWFITSLADHNSYIFKGATKLDDGYMLINNDPYKIRNGYKLWSFKNEDEIKSEFSSYFENFAFGKAQNNYYGIDERVFWVVCQKI